MSKFNELDELIVKRIKNGCDTAMALTGNLEFECRAVSPNREPYRVIDGRLQSLRKSGAIMYRNGKWHTSLS